MSTQIEPSARRADDNDVRHLGDDLPGMVGVVMFLVGNKPHARRRNDRR